MLITCIDTNRNSAANQPTAEEIIKHLYTNAALLPVLQHGKNFFHTRTFDYTGAALRTPDQWPTHLEVLRQRIRDGAQVSREYEQFLIPKHSGGTRRITAPNPELKSLQRNIADYLARILRVLPHDTAYAYVAGRSPRDANIQHVKNRSRWYMKLDIKDFFPSTSIGFLFGQLKKLYPLGLLPDDMLWSLLEICTLDGALPQGAPTSPLLSNLAMLPIDRRLSHELKRFNKSQYVYTRYADDMTISNEFGFRYMDVVEQVVRPALQDTPYRLKMEKTRYGSVHGRNWNLGMMITQDNRVTAGSERKERIKILTHKLFTGYQSGEWDLRDFQVYMGQVAYIDSIEPGYATELWNKAAVKYGLTIAQIKSFFAGL